MGRWKRANEKCRPAISEHTKTKSSKCRKGEEGKGGEVQ